MTGGAATGAGLALRRVAHRCHDEDSPLAAHPLLRPYLTDLAATHGLALREEALGTGQAYVELAAPVVDAVTSADEPMDLLVLAYGVPDVQPGRNLALRIADRCPGDPLAFAICDQGPAAAFTALRLIAEYARTGTSTRALLVVAEQSVVPYPLTAPAPVPDRHAAVALLFESDPSPVEVRGHPALPPEAVGAVLAADIAELTGARDGVTLVLGSGVDSARDARDASVSDVLRAVPGLPYTGLLARLADGEPGRLLVLADYDPTLGYLCVAALEPQLRPTDFAATGSPGTGGGVAHMAVKD